MAAQAKKSSVVESGDVGLGLGLAAFIANGEDLGPIIRHAFESGKPEALMQNLRSLVKKKEVEIEELCRVHYEEFILAVDELRGVLVDADELRGLLSGENLHLQDAADALLLRLGDLLELCSVKRNVGEAITTLKMCVKVTSLCTECNGYIAEGKFHPALNTLELIQKRYLQHIPVKLLKTVVTKRIPLLKMYIEKRACGEFNDWLVHIRRAAKQIGQAALARQKHDQHQHSGNLGHQDQNAAEDESAAEFDLTPVYRAHYIHVCLGIGDKFRDYYYKNRLMQLNLDMQISTSQPLLDSHRPFLAQVAGFFIVEERVLRTADGLLTEGQVEATWETAMAKITSILEDQAPRINDAGDLLQVKDYAALLAAVVRRYGYQVTQLVEVLDRSSDRYHHLLLAACRKEIDAVLAGDSYEQMVIRKESEFEASVAAFHLDLVADAAAVSFPYVAPFSSSVPDVCRVVRGFVEDSVSYLSSSPAAAASQRSLYDTVRCYLDRLLIEVLNDSLLNMIYARSLSISQLMQLSGNIAVLEQACGLHLLRAAELCGIPRRVAERALSASGAGAGGGGGLTARAVMKASQNASYNALINLANSKVDEFMTLLDNVNWTSEAAPEGACNDYMNEVVIYLETLVSTAQEILPLEALHKVVSGAMGHVADSVMATLLGDGVKRFTSDAVLGLDADLRMLEEFADDKFQSTGLAAAGKKETTTFRDCLVEIRQLVNLLLSSQPENFMNPVIRERNYGSLDYKKLAIVCDKYRDSADGLFGSLANRNTRHTARKKSMDVLKRRLKDFSY